MPPRNVVFATGDFYHVLTRGNTRQPIFLQPRDYDRFTKTISYYHFSGPKPKFSRFNAGNLLGYKPDLDSKFVDIVSYCLMPNHVHLLLRQKQDSGISTFIRQSLNSYAKYFNEKHKRSGSPFEGRFKTVRVESDEQLLHVSRYIHLNPVVSGLVRGLADHRWSSYHEFVQERVGFCDTEAILGFFDSVARYREFLEDQIDYGSSLELIKHRLLDEV